MSLVEKSKITVYKILCDCGGEIFMSSNEFDKAEVATSYNTESSKFYPSNISHKTYFNTPSPIMPRCRKCGKKHIITFNTNDFTIKVERVVD